MMDARGPSLMEVRPQASARSTAVRIMTYIAAISRTLISAIWLVLRSLVSRGWANVCGRNTVWLNILVKGMVSLWKIFARGIDHERGSVMISIDVVSTGGSEGDVERGPELGSGAAAMLDALLSVVD